MLVPTPISAGAGGDAGAGAVLSEARFCAQAWWFSNIYSENGEPVSTKSRRRPKGAHRVPQDPPRIPQGLPRVP